MKAIDFLFEEGHKILQEIRDKKKNKDKKDISVEKSGMGITELDLEANDKLDLKNVEYPIVHDKNELLHQKIDQFAFSKKKEEEIKHLLSLLDIYIKTYRQTKEQYAKWGSALVPTIVLNNMDEAEKNIVNTTLKLKNILKEIYGIDIYFPEIS